MASNAGAHEVRQSVFRLVRRLRQERPDAGLSYSQLVALGWLERDGSMTNADLAAAEGVAPQTMMRTTAELVAGGLISRADNPEDRRQVLLTITEAGRELILEDRRRRDSFLAEAMETTLTPTERELLRLAAGLLDRLAEYQQ
ncbi:MarR family winged helix-turn-helix transcriptional regulator [Kribbella sp. VKM Ac-2568]|uniref:MarR family winged helix-turn-helix transcriptional regulator n=1 Tax=Kribbella sp. VKM Ac-2568 TaxID=2512219 RepID=UPI00104B5169|nr:MarR family transcriptional regulator [Kribbella sp. VKM Ac-2568]TCM51362.1 DNA-binding MarR family transcriptional regulator [Kribbella sp. VKM Ac-2568]